MCVWRMCSCVWNKFVSLLMYNKWIDENNYSSYLVECTQKWVFNRETWTWEKCRKISFEMRLEEMTCGSFVCFIFAFFHSSVTYQWEEEKISDSYRGPRECAWEMFKWTHFGPCCYRAIIHTICNQALCSPQEPVVWTASLSNVNHGYSTPIKYIVQYITGSMSNLF